MLALVTDIFNWLEAFYWVEGFLLEVISVCGVAIEFVTFWVRHLRGLSFHLWLGSFNEKICVIRGGPLERLHTWVELLVLVPQWILCHALQFVSALVPGLPLERNISSLVFDPRDQFFPHLGHMPGIFCLIGWAYWSVWCLQVFWIYKVWAIKYCQWIISG